MSTPKRTRMLWLVALIALPCAPGAAPETYRYEYDDAGRLIEARSTSHLITYDYDAAGTVVERNGGPNLQVFVDGFEGDAP